MLFNYKWKWYQSLVLNIISQGPMPKHIAIISDGNRRFAKQNKLGTSIDGHTRGVDKVRKILPMLIDIGIEELTMYAFSLENFKRSKEEVDGLMGLTMRTLQMFLEDIEEIHKLGICVDIIGDWSKIPDELFPKLASLMIMTRNNTKIRLHVAFVYTGRNEIVGGASRVIRQLCEKDKAGHSVEDITENVLEESLGLYPSKPVDILLRTSGECRLSDFLLWQTSDSTFIKFEKDPWPAIKGWKFLQVIFEYQSHILRIQYMKTFDVAEKWEEGGGQRDVEKEVRMIDLIREKRWAILTAFKELLEAKE